MQELLSVSRSLEGTSKTTKLTTGLGSTRELIDSVSCATQSSVLPNYNHAQGGTGSGLVTCREDDNVTCMSVERKDNSNEFDRAPASLRCRCGRPQLWW